MRNEQIFPHLCIIQLLSFYALLHGAEFRFRHFTRGYFYQNFYA